MLLQWQIHPAYFKITYSFGKSLSCCGHHKLGNTWSLIAVLSLGCVFKKRTKKKVIIWTKLFLTTNAFQQQCSTNKLPSQALNRVFWSRYKSFFVNNWHCYWCSLIGNGCSSLVCKHSFVPTFRCHTSRFLCSFSRSPKTIQGKRFKTKSLWNTIHRACIHLYNPE